MTDTNTTTAATDVLGSVRSQLRDRLTTLQGEITRLDALTREAARIERTLATLDDDPTAPDADGFAATLTPVRSEPGAITAVPLAMRDAEPPAEPRPPRGGSRTGSRTGSRKGWQTGPRAVSGNRPPKPAPEVNGNHALSLTDTMIEILRTTGPITSGELIPLVAAAMPARAKAENFKQGVYVALSSRPQFKKGPDKTWALTKAAAATH